MSISNVQPLALSVEETKNLQHGAKSVWHRALVEVSRGLSPAQERAARRELGLAMYRLAVEEFDGLPETSEPECPRCGRLCLACRSASPSNVVISGCEVAEGSGPVEEMPCRGEP